MSELKTLKKLLCPLPVNGCLTNGCSEAPKACKLNLAVPKRAGSGTAVNSISGGRVIVTGKQ